MIIVFIVCRLKDAWLVQQAIHNVGLSPEHIGVYWGKPEQIFHLSLVFVINSHLVTDICAPVCHFSLKMLTWSRTASCRETEKQNLAPKAHKPSWPQILWQTHAGHDKTANTAGSETTLSSQTQTEISCSTTERHTQCEDHTHSTETQTHPHVYGRSQRHTSSLVQRR